MMQFYKYIFYRMYCWNRDYGVLQSFGLATMQAMSAVLSLIIIQIADVILLVEKLSNANVLLYFGRSSVLVWSAIAGAVCIAVIMLFGGENGYKKIIDEFDKQAEPSARKVVRGLLIWLYIGFWAGGLLFVVWA